ncbi:MAG: sigma 54-interacting transcriptional regulator [Gemmatimonadales bacterium]
MTISLTDLARDRPPAPDDTAGAAELSTLFDLSQVLSGANALGPGLAQALSILTRYPGATRSAVTLIDVETSELYIEASTGLTPTGQLVRYQLGEGVTGHVVQTGEAMIVPDVGAEPRFLHRSARRPTGSVSFLCVPILLDHRPVGALSIDLPFEAGRDFAHLSKYLHVVTSLIALALRTQRPIDAERRHLREENSDLREKLREKYDFSHLVGTSSPMREIFRQVAQVAPTVTSVLLRGESGTGKELIASAIHYNSMRAGGPFIKVNCAALPETLMESELFGHERGAFTGALARKKGKFEVAHGGTLFLDEIGELSLSTQARLLRALQEREFERVGGNESVRVDVRVIAATSKDLEQAILGRTFRDDLYYRLNVYPIFLPPLRERKPDILLLADHFLEKYAKVSGKRIRRITTPAIDLMMRYHWPGNVRELENIIERAVVVCAGDAIHGRHLPPTLQAPDSTVEAPGSLVLLVARLECDLIQDALKTTRGNVLRASQLLSTTERIFRYKLRKHGVDPRRFY